MVASFVFSGSSLRQFFREVGDLWAPIRDGKRVDLRALLRGRK